MNQQDKTLSTVEPTKAVPAAAAVGHYRWTICSLLFFATTINYLDRNILGILAPTLQREIGWTPVEYGYITTAFQAAYALGLVWFGWFIDKYGTKIGYSLSLIGWTLAAAAHALAQSVFGFGVARFFLGLSEAGGLEQSGWASWSRRAPSSSRAAPRGCP